MQSEQDITIRATLTIRAVRWSAEIVGRPPLSRITASGETRELTCKRLTATIADALPALAAVHRDGLEPDEITAVRVLATTSRTVPADPHGTLDVIPIPRLPGHTCLTVPVEQSPVDGDRVRLSVDPAVAVLGGLSAAGPVLPVAEQALHAAIRGKLAVAPLAELGITSPRLLRTTTFRFPMDTATHRSAS